MSFLVWRKNKTGTSKVGAISKAQKARKTFLKKKLEIFEFLFFQKMSHSAEKCKRGYFWFIYIYSVAKYQKTRKGDSFETLKNFRKKSRTVPKKIDSEGPFSVVRFCRLRKKSKKWKRDPFALISADRTWPYGSSFSSFDCKKSGPIRVRL